METCWSKIRFVEDELAQQKVFFFVTFVQQLATQGLLSRYMLSGFINGATDNQKVWNEAHKFFGKQNIKVI